MWFKDGKAEFLATITPVSSVTIILIFWLSAQETFVSLSMMKTVMLLILCILYIFLRFVWLIESWIEQKRKKKQYFMYPLSYINLFQ